MRYKRMLCWITTKDKKRIQEVAKSTAIQIKYAKNFNDFAISIQGDDYIVISCNSLSRKYSKTVELARLNNSKIFHIFARYEDSNIQKELDFSCEPNVVSHQYSPHDLIDEYLGNNIDIVHQDTLFNKIWLN